jgi:epoxide hydrolase-like predicted phosphatase
MMEKQFKVVIFDMGGVLIKTVDRTPRTALANQFGMTYENLEALVYNSETARQAMVGKISENDHFNAVLNQLGVPDFGIRPFQEAFWGGDELDVELVSYIESIKNHYTLGLLSNAMDATRQWLTEKYDLLRLFDECVFSAEVKMAKPDYQIYHLMLKRLKMNANEAIFIDDFIENLEAANQLGISTVHYQSTQRSINALNELLFN